MLRRRRDWWKGWRVDPDNVPEALPGIYRFTCLANGKVYIGMSKSVFSRCRHHSEDNSPPKFASALKAHGRRGFLCEPLFYWTSDDPIDRSFLYFAEADLIALHDAVRNGYNIKEKDGPGPYGPEHSAALRAGWEKRRERQRLDPRPPSEKIREAAIRKWADPAYRAMHDATRTKMVAGGRVGGFARARNLPHERIVEIGRLAGLIGGSKGALAQRAKMSPEELRAMNSKGGRTAHQAKDADGKSIHAKRLGAASAAATTSEFKREVGRRGAAIAVHDSEQARANHRRGAQLRESNRRRARHDFEMLLSGFAG